MDFQERISQLDPSLFDSVLSQTGLGDRRSLLAVQDLITQRHGVYHYLEIGSYMGGTIQPHLADERCEKIYSIDPRPEHSPDERPQKSFAEYKDNSTKKMLQGLRASDLGDVKKIQTFEKDASEIGDSAIAKAPLISFIDGEHTRVAVLSDYAFCIQVTDPRGVILFHDLGVIHVAVREICRELKRQGQPHVATKLEGSVFGIFLDPSLVEESALLKSMVKKGRYFFLWWRFRCQLYRILPRSIFEGLRSVWKKMKG